MGQLIPWTRPRGAVHDLLHLLSLSSDHCILLCLSEQELYVLQNWLPLDLEFKARYAVTLQHDGYEALTDDHELVGAWLTFVRGFQTGVEDVSCNIEEGLVSIAEALQALADRQCSGGGAGVTYPGGAALLNCIGDMTNEQLTGPGESAVEPGVPPEGFATWEEYIAYKCDAAHFIWLLERRHMVNLRNFDAVALTAAIVGPAIAGLAGLLPAAFTPAGFVVFVGSIVLIGVTAGWAWTYMDDLIEYWDANKADIICELFNAGTSTGAVGALSNFLEDGIQSIVFSGILEPLGPVLSGLLGEAFGQLSNNGIVEPLFKAIASVTSSGWDCSGCQTGTQCNEVDAIGPGTGNITGTGQRTLTGTLVNPPDPWYEIRVYFVANKCLKVSAYTGTPGNLGNDLCRLWFCDPETGDTLTYSSDTMTPTYECADTLVVISATPFTITLDIQAECETDGECNP